MAWFGAMQGQEFGPAKWAIAQRAGDLTNRDLDRAFDAGEILRTHVLRPTWHFVAPADIRWIQTLTAPRVQAFNAHWYRVNDLTARVLARGAEAIARALEGGMHLTRPELSNALRRARIQATGTRLACLVMHAELENVICSGPRRGKQFTYALMDDRVPSTPPKTRDDALAELARRYFQAHGPATIRDFVWWSSLRSADAREAIALASLREQQVEGVALWSLASDERAPRAAPSVRLLPIYDEYFVAYRDRGHVTSPAGGFSMWGSHLVVDGRAAGSWRAAGDDVALQPHAPLGARHAALAAREARRYQRFVTG